MIQPEKLTGNLVKMTRTKYETAKSNLTLTCPNVALISDEQNKVEMLMSNPKTDIGIAAWIDGAVQYYSKSEWNALETKPTAIGVFFVLPDGIRCLHGDVNSSVKWSSNTSVTVPGCFASSNASVALLDMAGRNNTDAVLAAVSGGTIADAPIFTWADGISFANGEKGYVPSMGELEIIRLNLVAINECRSLLGQTAIVFDNKDIWTSSQYSANHSWGWYGSRWYNIGKTTQYIGLCLAAL